MIAVVDCAVQAANVSMPLFPWRAFRNSYSSVRVRNVPRKIGKWNITNVTVQVTYPDGSIKTADAVLTGGVWVATVEGTATAGTSLYGYKILASGIDENGQPVSNYCLGRGDVTILEDDGELIPENVITYTRLLSAAPTTPQEGDMWKVVEEDETGQYDIWYIRHDGYSYRIAGGEIDQLKDNLVQDGIVFGATHLGTGDESMRSADDIFEQLNAVTDSIVEATEYTIPDLSAHIDHLDGLVPAQAAFDNQLADKAFVNSSVQTATANFRGNWTTWSNVPTNANDYPTDYAGSKTPTVNDYLVVQDASDLSSAYEGTWRFKYSGTWSTDGKNGWQPEYQVNETPMTAAQLAAINSNITAAKVTYYDTTLNGLEQLIDSI